MCQKGPSSTGAPGEPGWKGDLPWAPCVGSILKGTCLGRIPVDVRHGWSNSSRSPMARQIRPGYVHAVVSSTGGSGGAPLQQPLRQPPQADNPGGQTTDGSGPVRAPGQPNVLERRVRVMAHAEAVTQTPALSTRQPQQQEATTGGSGGPKVEEQNSACRIFPLRRKMGKEAGDKKLKDPNSLKSNEIAQVTFSFNNLWCATASGIARVPSPAGSPRVQHPLRPLSDLARLQPSSRLALPRWRSN